MLKFWKIRTANADLMSVQESVDLAIQEIARFTPLDGTALNGLVITTSAKTFAHNLKRMPIGWFVTDKNTNSNIFSTSKNVNNISFTGSAASIINVWIF